MQSSWDSAWEAVFASREWGKYPDLEVVRFVARNFYARQPRSAIKLLEVGCGTGANLWYMAREGFQVTGVDGSQKALDILRQRLNAENLSAEIHHGDIAQLPFADQTFDGVIDCECICCNAKVNTGCILDAIHRVLKPGGLLLSLAFTTATGGYGCGVPVDGDAHAFSDIQEGPLQGTGLARFTSEDDVHDLYGSRFAVRNLEIVRRTCESRQKQIEEWVITCARQA